MIQQEIIINLNQKRFDLIEKREKLKNEVREQKKIIYNLSLSINKIDDTIKEKVYSYIGKYGGNNNGR